MPTPFELAELRLADTLEAMYQTRDDDALQRSLALHVVRNEFDPRRLALAITKTEEAALWLGAARARATIPAALRES